MSVSAIIVTRGDQQLAPIADSLPNEWELLVWNNGLEVLTIWEPGTRDKCIARDVSDLSVYGRYAAIQHASGDLIYVQDDDCVVSDPQAIVEKWLEVKNSYVPGYHTTSIQWADRHVVCNMPTEFRHEFYEDHALVGFGACFHRDAPARAFARFDAPGPAPGYSAITDCPWCLRTCDIVFTMLTPRVLVDVPYENLPWAASPDRMWKQMDHIAERTQMRDLVRKVRDGG